ncbi:MAG: uncharacterized protein Satyrvirus31_5 [Satyrvirus sp.]|uniref:Methyltransferase type 11 domain-containing protein n=1 Tax=Satyrvirus sp. TaxID=2487771 RepID=A0A3G5AHB1_9VIRU|nr:MAG: uncharacterized protein Satyrvirus31_5 [Satyrvirus sp.]
MYDDHMISKLFRSNPTYRKYLVQLLGKFTNKLDKNIVTNMYHMIKQNEPDEKIVNFIQKNRIGMEELKSEPRASRISNVLFQFLKKDLKPNIGAYLDIGCNNGLITVELGKKLNLKSSQIYGIDVEDFSGQKIIPVGGFVFSSYDGYNIPYTDDYFDLVTCLMTLHHIKHIDIILSEIKRVTKKHGLVLVKEHNAYSEEIDWLIFLKHLFYDVMDYNITYEEFIKTYFQKCYSKNQLVELFKKYGFELVKLSGKKFLNRYHYSNPTQTFYALFTKN